MLFPNVDFFLIHKQMMQKWSYDGKHLSNILHRYENSQEHIVWMFYWTELYKDLNTTPQKLSRNIRWFKNIKNVGTIYLKVLTDIINFLAFHHIAFRCHWEYLKWDNSRSSDNFIDLFKLLSMYHLLYRPSTCLII